VRQEVIGLHGEVDDFSNCNGGSIFSVRVAVCLRKKVIGIKNLSLCSDVSLRTGLNLCVGHASLY
jgi:hypothetical protein